MKSISPDEAVDRIVAILPQLLRLLTRGMDLKPAELDLTIGQYKVLMAVREGERMSMGAISQSLGISLPATTELVDRLVRDGLARREADPSDRRVVLIALTKGGIQASSRCYDARHRRWLDLISQLNAAERSALVSHLSGSCELMERASERFEKRGETSS